MVHVSRQEPRFDVDELPAPICDFCGEAIEDETADCPARDEGRCHP